MSLRRISAPLTEGTALGNSRSVWRSNTRVAGPRFSEGERVALASPDSLLTKGRKTWMPLMIPERRPSISRKTSPPVKLFPSVSNQKDNSRWQVPPLERS